MSRESIIDKELDEDFIKATIIIQNNYESLPASAQQIIEKWIGRLAKINDGPDNKKIRNGYIYGLLEGVLKGALEGPFLKPPPSSSLSPLAQDSAHSLSPNKGFGAFSSPEKSSLMGTEEIERIIEENLQSIREDDVFNLSPRETKGIFGKGLIKMSGKDSQQGAQPTVKFDTASMYDITPSKSNRFRAGPLSSQRDRDYTQRESFQKSGLSSRREMREKKEPYSSRGLKTKVTKKDDLFAKPNSTDDSLVEFECYSKLAKLSTICSEISRLTSAHLSSNPSSNNPSLSDILSLAEYGSELAGRGMREMEETGRRDYEAFKEKYRGVMGRIESLEREIQRKGD